MRSHRALTPAVVAAALTFALAACAAAPANQLTASADRPTAPPSERGQATAAACGGGEPISLRRLEQSPRLTLEDLRKTAHGRVIADQIDDPMGLGRGDDFFEVPATPRERTYLGVVADEIRHYFELSRDNNRWELGSWGECEFRAVAGDLSAHRWHLTGSDPADSRLALDVEAGKCVGEEKQPAVERVDVQETDVAVIVVTWVREPALPSPTNGEVQVCAGIGIRLSTSVELQEPLGDRDVIDGGVVKAPAAS